MVPGRRKIILSGTMKDGTVMKYKKEQGKIYITKKNLVSFRSVKTTRRKLESKTMDDALDLEDEYDE